MMRGQRRRYHYQEVDDINEMVYRYNFSIIWKSDIIAIYMYIWQQP
jgi:hypothetical protein